MGSELAVIDEKAGVATTGGKISPLIPQDLAGFWAIAKIMAEGGLIPDAYKGNIAKTMSAMMLGAEIGISPFQAVQSIAVINGKPGIYGDMMIALVRGSGLLEYCNESIERPPAGSSVDNLMARCEVKRKGEPLPQVRTFSIEDAKKAKLWDKSGPWTQYPKRMLAARARSYALRDVFPDVLAGFTSREELEDESVPVPMVDTIQHAVDVASGNVQDAEVILPWHDSTRWKSLKAGFEEFILANVNRLGEVPTNKLKDMEEKWNRIVRPHKPWPLSAQAQSDQESHAGAENASGTGISSGQNTTEPVSTRQSEDSSTAAQDSPKGEEVLDDDPISQINRCDDRMDLMTWGRDNAALLENEAVYAAYDARMAEIVLPK